MSKRVQKICDMYVSGAFQLDSSRIYRKYIGIKTSKLSKIIFTLCIMVPVLEFFSKIIVSPSSGTDSNSLGVNQSYEHMYYFSVLLMSFGFTGTIYCCFEWILEEVVEFVTLVPQDIQRNSVSLTLFMAEQEGFPDIESELTEQYSRKSRDFNGLVYRIKESLELVDVSIEDFKSYINMETVKSIAQLSNRRDTRSLDKKKELLLSIAHPITQLYKDSLDKIRQKQELVDCSSDTGCISSGSLGIYRPLPIENSIALLEGQQVQIKV